MKTTMAKRSRRMEQLNARLEQNGTNILSAREKSGVLVK